MKIYLRVCLFADEVSAPLSFPAKSISENFPYKDFFAPWRRMIWKTACDLKKKKTFERTIYRWTFHIIIKLN